jgi:sialate O-acetylesterase
MINIIKEAIKNDALLVFLFHGVGGGHPINVSLEAHRELVYFLKQHVAEIWIAPLIDIAQYIKKYDVEKLNN